MPRSPHALAFSTLSTLIALSTFVVLSALPGCHGRSDPKAPIGAMPDQVARSQWPQVEVEPALAGWIAVERPIVEQGPVMKVSTPVRLLSDGGEYARVQYRYVFYGANGAPLRDQTGWKYARLEPRRPTFFSGNSTDAASDWRLEIQSNR